MQLQIVAWPEDRRCDRSWLLGNVAGAIGAIVMLSDKVGDAPATAGDNVKAFFY